jgi:ESCRT-II complex subunit VPS36
VGAPLELRELADGVRVLQSLSHSTEEVWQLLATARLCTTDHNSVRFEMRHDVICSTTCRSACTGSINRFFHPTPLQVCARVVELVRGEGLGPALSAHSAAAALHVPLAIAQAHLATAEAAGMLCRDDGPEGLRFFRNFFAEADAVRV